MNQELPKEEAERLAREVAQRMLTTPKKPNKSDIRTAKAIAASPRIPRRNRKVAAKFVREHE